MNIFFKNKEDLKLINAVKFILGYKPKKIQLYKLALLHKSNNSEESNERLEYLGDAVLGLIVANYLFKLYPYKDEGFLTKIRSKIVSRDSLNNLGRKIGIKELINLQKAKTKSYESVYGDAVEALIGACYLEKGFNFCSKKVINNVLVPYYDLDSLTSQTHNFKSKILEWAQKEKMKINFIVKKTAKSDKFSQFKSILYLNSKKLSEGYGKSKKNAEKDASRNACDKLELV